MHFEISDTVIERLREAIISWRTEESDEWFQTHHDELISVGSDQRNAAALVGYLAQWLDGHKGALSIVKHLIASFPLQTLAGLPVRDYIYLKLAEGLVAVAERADDAAITHLDVVTSLGERGLAQDGLAEELLALAYYGKGRSLWRQGKCHAALANTMKGRELATRLGYQRMAAVIGVLESRLYIEQNKLRQAAALLEGAEKALQQTHDTLTIARIHQEKAMIALREGRYDQGLSLCGKAVLLFRERDPFRTELGRALVTTAHAKEMIARHLATRIDADVAEHRAAGTNDAPNAPSTKPFRRRLEQLRAEAFLALRQAEEICQGREETWLAMVRIIRGFLFVDTGELEAAEIEAAEGYNLGAEGSNNVLMSRARILQSIIEMTKYEELIEERDDLTLHILRAQDYAKDSLALAKRTEDFRLVARAYLCMGLTLCSDQLSDLDAARDCCERAGEYIIPELRDNVWEDYQRLKAKLLRSGRVDVRFQAWSQGETNGKTFQQITEEFTDMIIPKVWEKEDRKISRVAKSLSISPKKVRRVLKKMGLQGE
ncbi:MAG: hypothetical protein ABSB35_37030 [Bryobacteraceae bacterium]|jgi:tetratricopeptide (TPR) repeat protein